MRWGKSPDYDTPKMAKAHCPSQQLMSVSFPQTQALKCSDIQL